VNKAHIYTQETGDGLGGGIKIKMPGGITVSDIDVPLEGDIRFVAASLGIRHTT
jgi:hypothetical protein